MIRERARIVLPARGRFDLRRLMASDGGPVPPPWRWRDGARPVLERPERLGDGSVRLLSIRPDADGVVLEVIGRSARDIETLAPLAARVRRALALDGIPAVPGRRRPRPSPPNGPPLRGTTAFEDVVAVLAASGQAPDGARLALCGLIGFGSRCPAEPRQRAFPAPDAVARLPLRLLRQRTGLGHRAAWIRALARDVARGARDLRDLDDMPPPEAARALRDIAGLGPAGIRAVLRMLGHGGGTPAAGPPLRPSRSRARRPRPARRS